MAFRIPLTGLISVHSEADVGKTAFCLECGSDPEKIMFVDADIKGKSTVQQMLADGINLGRYEDWTKQTKDMKELAAFELGLKIIDSIKPGQYDALIWDTWSSISRVTKSEISAHPKKYRDNWSAMGVIKGAEENSAANDLEAKLIANLLDKVPMLLLTTHLKSYYVGNKKVEGKFIPDCKQALITKSRLRLWLRRNPTGRPVPIGLVLKRIDKKVMVDGRIRTINVLPQRLVPGLEDDSLWSVIERYWNDPWGDRALNEQDALTEYELSILDGTLTTDQKVAMHMALLEAEQDAAETQMILTGQHTEPERAETDIIADILKGIALGQTNDEIKAEVKGATTLLIIKTRKG